MLRTSFADSASCIVALRDALTMQGAVDIQPQMPEALAQACEDTEPELLPAQALGLRIRRWVIRSSDLDLFRIAKDAALALASSKFAIGDLSLAAATAIGYAEDESWTSGGRTFVSLSR